MPLTAHGGTGTKGTQYLRIELNAKAPFRGDLRGACLHHLIDPDFERLPNERVDNINDCLPEHFLDLPLLDW